MFYSKKKRIAYLGFDDFWFKVVGIFIISFATFYLFSHPSGHHSLTESLVTWSVSLVFSLCDWHIIRAIMVLLRNMYPNLKDSAIRVSLFFVAIVCTVFIVDFIGINLLSGLTNESYNFLERSQALLSIILISIMTFAIYEAVYFFVRLRKSIRDEEQSKQAMVQAELDGLRNQAQPHFFFNTLNTLRDIIDQNSKEDAKEFVDKLADVYRFLLEAGTANLIPLRDELKFAQAYIHIQSERFGNNLTVRWDISDTALDLAIVPMSLQLLLENAIKHNVISKSRPLAINVKVYDRSLIVENKMQPKSTQLPSTKMGLKNISKRYNLISNTSIKITNDGHQFKVRLPLLKSAELKH